MQAPPRPRVWAIDSRPAQPTRQAQPARPAYPAQPVEPTRQAQPARPAYPAQPVEPTRPAVPAQPTRLAQPTRPAQPTRQAQPAEPAQPDLARLAEQLRQLQEENAELKARLTVLETMAQLPVPLSASQPGLAANPAGQTKPALPAQPGNAEEQDQTEPSRLEAWLRRNPAWLDEPCPFKKATGRTWRQIAGNEGDKISMNGRGLQVPRAYLHSIESWAEASENIRLKAKLALALCGNEAGQ